MGIFSCSASNTFSGLYRSCKLNDCSDVRGATCVGYDECNCSEGFYADDGLCVLSKNFIYFALQYAFVLKNGCILATPSDNVLWGMRIQ